MFKMGVTAKGARGGLKTSISDGWSCIKYYLSISLFFIHGNDD